MITSWRWKSGITNDKNYFSEKVQENILISVKKVQIQGLVGYFSWNPTAFTIGYCPTAIRLGWKPIPSKARVTRDDEQAHYNARYCLPDSHFLLVFNPETSSRVTLAALGIGFQPNLPSMPLNNQKPTPICLYFYLLIFFHPFNPYNPCSFHHWVFFRTRIYRIDADVFLLEVLTYRLNKVISNRK